MKHTILMKIACALCLASICAHAQNGGSKVGLSDDHRKYFDEYRVKGSIIIYDLKRDRTFYFDEARTLVRYSPASTFKIFNSLVGLETGVISDTSYVIPWDSVKRGNYAPWNRSNSFKSAFKYSVVWYYQEIARRVGEERMKEHIAANGYGNQNIGATIDGFWLSDYGGQLRISQVEQIEFLRKLYHEQLKFSKRSQQLVKGIMLMEGNEKYKLYAKTGMSSENNVFYGWYVGWFEVEDNVYFFATHMETEDPKNIHKGARQGVTFAVFRSLELIE